MTRAWRRADTGRWPGPGVFMSAPRPMRRLHYYVGPMRRLHNFIRPMRRQEQWQISSPALEQTRNNSVDWGTSSVHNIFYIGEHDGHRAGFSVSWCRLHLNKLLNSFSRQLSLTSNTHLSILIYLPGPRVVCLWGALISVISIKEFITRDEI